MKDNSMQYIILGCIIGLALLVLSNCNKEGSNTNKDTTAPMPPVPGMSLEFQDSKPPAAMDPIDSPGDTISYAMPVNIVTLAGMRYAIFITRGGVGVRNLTLDSLDKLTPLTP